MGPARSRTISSPATSAISIRLAVVVRYAVGTIAPCRIVRIGGEAMSELKANHPAVAQALRVAALIEDATMREWLMNIGRRSAEERIAHLFCELHARFAAVDLVYDDSFRLPLTQFDLGDTVGLSYVHVNRTLQSLRHLGLITLRGKTLSILNQPALQAMAEFRPAYLQAGRA